ncbi:MAG TPA: tetratricopeptide repeat protein, partial [Tepidisphaeraceae bacterium]
VWGTLARLSYLQQPDAMGAHLNPWVFHSANIAVHVVSVLLVYAILQKLIRDKRASCIGAMLFALHPLQVESVAWCAGMKDVLGGMLGLLAIWQYLTFVRDSGPNRRWHYVAASTAFVLGMLAKPSVMVVPIMVGAIDLILLRRSFRTVLPALAPWLLLAIACAIGAKIAQPAYGVTAAPLWARPLIAADSLAFYLYKLVWPVSLGIDYGRRPDVLIERGWIYLTWIVPVALAAWLMLNRRRTPELLVAGIILVAGVAPVLGLSTFLFQHFSTTTDHYLYLAMLGPALAAAWLVNRYPAPRTVAVAAVVLVMLGIRTIFQTRVWQNDIALFSHALAVNPESSMAMSNLGHVYATQNDLDRAQPLFEKALRMYPDYYEAHVGLANVLVARGQLDQAITHRMAALNVMARRPPQIRADITPLVNALSRDLIDAGRLGEARQFLGTIRQDDPETIENLKLLDEKMKHAATQPGGGAAGTTAPKP